MIFEKLAALLSEQFGVDVDSITMDTSFEDLGADSLDIVEMTMAVEEEFGLEDMDEEDLSGISTVADLVRYLIGRKAGLPVYQPGPSGKRPHPQLLRQREQGQGTAEQ